MLSFCFAITVMVTNSLCTPCKPKDPQNQLERPENNGSSAKRGDPQSVSDAPIAEGAKRPRSKCCPYNFDSSLCQVINDRVLCGYDQNVGKPENDNAAFGLSGGCRIRGGRLECGYEQAPFTNIRRPPAWNNAGGGDIAGEFEAENEDYIDENADNKPNDAQIVENLKYVVPKKGKLKYTGAVTKCVEIKERIVCREM